MPLIGEPQHIGVNGFNPCVFKHERGWAVLYRRDRTKKRQFHPSIRLAFLDGDMKPYNDQHWLDDAEDPRLFKYKGALYCAYTNWPNDYRCAENVQMYCRLTAALRPEAHVRIQYGTPPEKNWTFFEGKHNLCCVYELNPHRVLVTRGDKVVGEHVSPWPGDPARPRGGTSPALVDDLYYSFYHTWFKKRVLPDGTKLPRASRFYYTGAYAFSPTPPYAVKRVLPAYLLGVESPETRIRFPLGAVLLGSTWLFSDGQANAQCWMTLVDHHELVNAMSNVGE